ncbi:MAG: peptidoglycan glycosyltransferase [Sulfurimonas sp. RIFCSPHIGHO2_12_FULL_36_9]|uniref:peptidoglycan D,D-transpeptidase FtsI family protein n=1 Tax=Sulfurimonas sp. RIFCSPLOWO2_12_36_12 TaxID=1802253 RepID=UPI0008B3BF05|nr:penicillin-binding protein 2 [Sulfurimonas sp. RIFCSPLOWO2_12_36_12]OHD97037.1 MAG: peptidoglycan glycosyltransferase [Sulfurimonas sp. RIFCSPHIGHO2_12_FULL_36_9]OHE01663.1 MAG: peptidoglycan glycosyltransferase [Sulfurimonas sp. RIFCSPLOWO2_12_36_12]
MNNQNKSKKIFLLYSLLVAGFLLFLGVMLITTIKYRDLPSLYAQNSSKAVRGSIISADGFNIATTIKLYKAVVNTYYIDPQKRELFIKLFSIYSEIDAKEVEQRLNKQKGIAVLSYNLPQKQAQYLKQLAFELRRLKVFIERKNPITGKTSLHGLSIIESGESREYAYDKLLTPIIGYPHKVEEDGYTYVKGVKGLEKKFENELQPKQDELSQGLRDINSYIILNKNSFTKQEINGLDVKLNIPISLQIRVENMLDIMKADLQAKEVIATVMNSTNGKVIGMASSNRFLPKSIQKDDYQSLNSSMIEYSFEPGSVIKTVIFSILLDKGLVNPYDMVNGHNGRYTIGKKTITDEHKFDWLSAEDIIVHSSNVGIAQIAQKLTGSEFNQGLIDFGFSKASTPDLVYEKVGSVPSTMQLNNEIYKATCSYGYGMRANLMQLIRAYSAFNNNGRIVTPKIINCFIDNHRKEITIPNEEQIQVIKSTTADRMKSILIKTVNEGTGVKAKTAGLEIGGKTGTAHIVEEGKYVNEYNTAFIGFANDKESKYSIGVIVVKPKKSQFAAQTAVPVFKKTIDILVEDGYLKPTIIEDNASKPNVI